jgi:hypothetical protein
MGRNPLSGMLHNAHCFLFITIARVAELADALVLEASG